jgi:hypothetical protein
MLEDQTVRDLLVITLVKAAAITLIYYACFAAYDGRSVDAVSHLLGPSGITPHFNVKPGIGQ